MTAVVDRLVGLALLIWLIFALVHGFAWFLLVLSVSLPLVGAVKSKRAARRMAERQRVARLIRNADGEHRLIQNGFLAGVYGSFEPPPALWGVGMVGLR